MLAEHPGSFPRDAPLIRTQGQFFVFDDVLAAIGRITGASVESLFLCAYVVAVATVWLGVVLVGSRLYASAWLALAFVALVAAAASCHVTTALWFAILVGTALMVVDRRWRRPGAVAIGVAVVVLAW